jgi:Mg-chelatase subunit ChlD
MRNTLTVLLSALALVGASSNVIAQDQFSTDSPAPRGELQIEIQSPTDDIDSVDGQATIEVEGMASAIGGVQYIDMMFVMDTSQSLRGTDPENFRAAGAVGLVRNLSPKSDIKIGVVGFNSKGQLAQGLTHDRDKVALTIQELSRSGSTDLAAGIRMALAELEKNGRPGSSRVIMLFTDGKSSRRTALAATREAQLQRVTIQTLLLGSSKKGGEILDEIAWGTGGSFVQVTDPESLPEAFLNLRTTGVDSVTLSVNGSSPIAARLAGGTFSGSLPLEVGENRIVALATSLDGQKRESAITVNVRDASCAALQVAAVKDGRPVLSLDERAVEIVVDASRSMWGRMGGEPKMVVAKDILEEVSYWFPEDLDLALRAYGSTSPSDDADCADSTLLVPFGDENREPIRRAIAGLRPLGQTPIAYALNQAARDFGPLQNDRAVVLVTDGLESCGGDPVRAARELREQGITVHLIGFGLGNAADEDAASLHAVAEASGGRYVTAGSPEELKEALAETVGTSFTVFKGNLEVANGSLGSNEPMLLPAGAYRVKFDTAPPQEFQINLTARNQSTLTLQKRSGLVSHFERRNPLQYASCEDAIRSFERLGGGKETQESEGSLF